MPVTVITEVQKMGEHKVLLCICRVNIACVSIWGIKCSAIKDNIKPPRPGLSPQSSGMEAAGLMFTFIFHEICTQI